MEFLIEDRGVDVNESGGEKMFSNSVGPLPNVFPISFIELSEKSVCFIVRDREARFEECNAVELVLR